MTSKQLEAKRAEAMSRVELVHGTAIKIRALLEEARKAYGAGEWEEDDCEARILELVSEEG